MNRKSVVCIAISTMAIAGILSPASAQTASGWTFTALHSFAGANSACPLASLVQGSDGSFFGTTSGDNPISGADNDGTVFNITPAGALTTLHSFTGTDGVKPEGLVLGSDGNFYATTHFGGNMNNGQGYGTIFTITPAHAVNTLYDFSTLGAGYSNTDGAWPDGSLVPGADGCFYGTASYGGANGSGAVFKVTPKGAENALYSFTAHNGNYQNTDGSCPGASLVLGSDGNFYGTTVYGGGSGAGTVFKITPSGALNTLHSFTGGSDGGTPWAGLVQGSDGNFYGTTTYGGNTSLNNGRGLGTVFKITTSGALKTLHSFSGYPTEGAFPEAGLVLGSDGNFYGTAELGGSGFGAVYKITPSGTLTTLYLFSQTNSANAISSLVQGADGSFYGTACYGGTSDNGTVFKLTPPASSTYVLWNNSGTAALWHIPASGAVTSAPFGPYAGLTPSALASDASGNAYILWTSTTGSATISMVNSSLALTTSQSFGPYTGWTAKSMAVGPDGHVHLLWNGPSNAASIYNIVLGTSLTTQAYGPVSGWQATQIAVDSSNNTRVLWNNTSTNAASLWNITSGGTVTSQLFGPYAGYKAQNLVAGPANLPRIIWNYTPTNAAALWQMLPLGNEASTALGAYSGWAASGLAINWGGDSDVLWTNASTGQASIWDVTSTGTHTSTSYGPYSGWKAIAIAPGP